MHSQRPVSFVAKSEISRWPFVGWLAARAGTLFHQSGSTNSLAIVMARALSARATAKERLCASCAGLVTSGLAFC